MLRHDVTMGVIHCSATRPGQDITAAEIRRWHVLPRPHGRGWRDIGYHCVIDRQGGVTPGRAISFAPQESGQLKVTQGAHVSGWNHGSIAICLVGGLDKRGRSVDVGSDPTKLFTLAQVAALSDCMRFYGHMFPGIRWVGHRDLSPDTDGDGKVESHEWLKTCPGFDVRAWMRAPVR